MAESGLREMLNVTISPASRPQIFGNVTAGVALLPLVNTLHTAEKVFSGSPTLHSRTSTISSFLKPHDLLR